MTRLISVGNVVVDIAMEVPKLPERGGDIVATHSQIVAGGGLNVMVAAARQGMHVAYAGAHGTGPFGDLARSALRAEGIEVLLRPISDGDTGYDIALVDAEGERTFVTAVGAEARLTAEDLEGIRVEADDLVHVSGYGVLRDPNASAIAGWLGGLPDSVRVLVDPGPLGEDIDPEILAAVRARADWWSCNEREAWLATGERDPEAAIAVLAEAAPGRGVLVRCGADGCLIAVPDDPVQRIPGFPVAAVDTNGAGDAHAGGFLAALGDGLDPVAAARRANACAALAVTRRGPATAPTRAEVDALLATSE